MTHLDLSSYIPAPMKNFTTSNVFPLSHRRRHRNHQRHHPTYCPKAGTDVHVAGEPLTSPTIGMNHRKLGTGLHCPALVSTHHPRKINSVPNPTNTQLPSQFSGPYLHDSNRSQVCSSNIAPTLADLFLTLLSYTPLYPFSPSTPPHPLSPILSFLTP